MKCSASWANKADHWMWRECRWESETNSDRESEALRGSVDGRDVAVRLAEPSLALLTVRVFIRCGGPCYTTEYTVNHRELHCQNGPGVRPGRRPVSQRWAQRSQQEPTINCPVYPHWLCCRQQKKSWVLNIDVLFMFVRTFLEIAVYRPVTQRFFPLSTESHCWETGRHTGACLNLPSASLDFLP